MFRILWSIFREYILYLIKISILLLAGYIRPTRLLDSPFPYSPQYATKHRPRTPTIDEPHGAISIKYRMYILLSVYQSANKGIDLYLLFLNVLFKEAAIWKGNITMVLDE
jgi:hypothetical protein